MKPQNTIDSVLEDEIDLLVDGELPESRRETLLRRLDRERDGWKRCARGFLEAQAWRGAMGEISPVDSGRPARRWKAPLATLAAAVLGFVAAAALVRPSEAVSSRGEAPPAPPSEPEVRLIPYPVVEAAGFVRTRDERGNQFYETRGEIPDMVLRALREAGHEVQHVERVIDLPRQEGEPIQLPIRETRVFIKHEL